MLLGFGAAPLWSSKCAYLTTTAIAYSKSNSQDQDAVITRFFGIFFMIFQSAQVWGNLISSAVLQRSDKSSYNSTNSSDYDVVEVCGANDCGQGMLRSMLGLYYRIPGLLKKMFLLFDLKNKRSRP